jgi:hypothetical protein
MSAGDVSRIAALHCQGGEGRQILVGGKFWSVAHPMLQMCLLIQQYPCSVQDALSLTYVYTQTFLRQDEESSDRPPSAPTPTSIGGLDITARSHRP